MACRLAGQARDAFSLFEPMDVEGLGHDPVLAVAGVRQFLAETRDALLRDGTAPSKQSEGEVPDNPFGPPDESGRRHLRVEVRAIRPKTALTDDFTLVVKHNAAFAALLPALKEVAPCVAMVRHPVDVLASWASVPLPVREGRLPAGERLDSVLSRRLAGEGTVVERQCVVLDWFFDRFAAHLLPAEVVRYEDMVATGGRSLWSALGLEGDAVSPLVPRQASAVPDSVLQGAEALFASGGAWERWYTRQSVRDAIQRLIRADP